MMTNNASSADCTRAGVAIVRLHHNSIMSRGSHDHFETIALLLCLVPNDIPVCLICAAYVLLAGRPS